MTPAHGDQGAAAPSRSGRADHDPRSPAGCVSHRRPPTGASLSEARRRRRQRTRATFRFAALERPEAPSGLPATPTQRLAPSWRARPFQLELAPSWRWDPRLPGDTTTTRRPQQGQDVLEITHPAVTVRTSRCAQMNPLLRRGEDMALGYRAYQLSLAARRQDCERRGTAPPPPRPSPANSANAAGSPIAVPGDTARRVPRQRMPSARVAQVSLRRVQRTRRFDCRNTEQTPRDLHLGR